MSINSASADELADLARDALADQREEDAVPVLKGAARKAATDASLWQWSGLLHRALDDRVSALPCFERALQLAPADATIAHGYARVRLEAGLPAVEDFLRCQRLSPLDGGILLGLAAARLAEGQGDEALAGIDQTLSAHPLWVEGHRDRINLSWMLGHGSHAFDRITEALRLHPQAPPMWEAKIAALVEAKAFPAAHAAIAESRKTSGQSPFCDLHEAILLSETGRASDADACFSKLATGRDPTVALHRVRHELRNGRIDVATSLIEIWIKQPEAEMFWPYADALWRLTGDTRRDWLDGNGAFVQVMDMADRIDIPPLAALLGTLHKSRHQHLDQSVRGGTQTDGALLSRIDPEILALRKVIVDAVTDYVANLPPVDPAHPFLGRPRDRKPRFAGSWSVRLAGAGFHANHIHPAGWISSALYVEIPPSVNEAGDAGWLAIGEPQAELGLGLLPSRKIEPKPGRLVLFPSIAWHGTRPFEAGERLTVAFDVAPPAKRAGQ